MTGLDPAALERAAKALWKVLDKSLDDCRGLARIALEASGYPSVVAEQQQELDRGEAHRGELMRDVEAWRARVAEQQQEILRLARERDEMREANITPENDGLPLGQSVSYWQDRCLDHATALHDARTRVHTLEEACRRMFDESGDSYCDDPHGEVREALGTEAQK